MVDGASRSSKSAALIWNDRLGAFCVDEHMLSPCKSGWITHITFPSKEYSALENEEENPGVDTTLPVDTEHDLPVRCYQVICEICGGGA